MSGETILNMTLEDKVALPLSLHGKEGASFHLPYCYSPNLPFCNSFFPFSLNLSLIYLQIISENLESIE